MFTHTLVYRCAESENMYLAIALQVLYSFLTKCQPSLKSTHLLLGQFSVIFHNNAYILLCSHINTFINILMYTNVLNFGLLAF